MWRTDDVGIEYAKSLTPPRSQLFKETGLYYRWKTVVQRKGQQVTTKVWGGRDNYTQAMALKAVIDTAWGWDFKDGFGACPFELEIQ